MVQFLGVKTEQKVTKVGVQINAVGEGGKVANCTWSTLWITGGAHIGLPLLSPVSGPSMLGY